MSSEFVNVRRGDLQTLEIVTWQHECNQACYLGCCPECAVLPEDGKIGWPYLNVGRVHCGFCETHGTRCSFGSNLFSHWRYEDEKVWDQNIAKLYGYREISDRVSILLQRDEAIRLRAETWATAHKKERAMKDIATTEERTTVLANLAARIRTEHAAATNSARTAIGHAINAGRLLIEAKTKLGHGRWLPWLSENCPDISIRTAQVYMRLALKAPTFLDSNTQNSAHLSINQALNMVAEPRVELVPEPEHSVELEPEVTARIDAPDAPFTIGPHTAAIGERLLKDQTVKLFIWPSNDATDALGRGYFYLAALYTNLDMGAGSLDGTPRPVRRDYVPVVADRLYYNWCELKWKSLDVEALDHNLFLYSSRAERFEREVLGRE